MHHPTLLLTLLSVTPLFAAPLPKAADHHSAKLEATTTSDAIKRQVADTITYPAIETTDRDDFVKRGHLRLSVLGETEPVTAVKRSDAWIVAKPVYSPLPDSYTVTKRDVQDSRDEAWIVAVPSPSPDAATAIKRDNAAEIVNWPHFAGSSEDATFTKRQDTEEPAVGIKTCWPFLECDEEPYPSVTVIDADPATAIKRSNDAWIVAKPSPDARMDATAIKRDNDAWLVAKPSPDAHTDATAIKRDNDAWIVAKPSPDARMDATAFKRQEADDATVKASTCWPFLECDEEPYPGITSADAEVADATIRSDDAI